MVQRAPTGALLALTAALVSAPAFGAAQVLRFSAPEGAVLNEFYRQDAVAAHVVLTPGRTPRLVVVFPAGNSGAALWFETQGEELAWRREIDIASASEQLPDGLVLRGISAQMEASGGPVRVKQAIASSVRVLRNFQDTGAVPAAVLTRAEISDRRATWRRRRIDGASGYLLSIEMLEGSLAERGGALELRADSGGQMKLRVTALTGDPPLTPLAEAEILTNAAAPDEKLRRALAFLSYEEKLLAGSWRFNTYFGRDTLMSLRLLAPVLRPEAMQAGLTAVLERLNEAGEVAHEEDIGEFALLRRLEEKAPQSAEPIYDYKMIDDDYLLPLVAAHALLDTPGGRTRAAAFLARRTSRGATYGAQLVRNMQYVVASARPFAREPRWEHLMELKRGQNVGNWRDSEDGLGRGRYAYDVNGVFVPAALQAIARLNDSGLLNAHLDREAKTSLANARSMATTWLRAAPQLFDVEAPTQAARAAVRDHAQQAGVDASAALASLPKAPLRFRAVSLDGSGRPVAIMNSDEAFALLFLDPAPTEVARVARTLARPFPAGLMTDVGLLVANAAHAPAALKPRFDRTRYHGAVIWSWQQAMFASGVQRQLARKDLDEATRAALLEARERLKAAIKAADAVRGSELWSWSYADGRYRVEPFGQGAQHETESNAVQLWSTVYLARPLEDPRL